MTAYPGMPRSHPEMKTARKGKDLRRSEGDVKLVGGLAVARAEEIEDSLMPCFRCQD